MFLGSKSVGFDNGVIVGFVICFWVFNILLFYAVGCSGHGLGFWKIDICGGV